MAFPSLFARRPDPTDMSSSLSAEAQPTGGPGFRDVLMAAGSATDPRTTRWIGYGLAFGAFALGIYDLFRPSILAAAFLLMIPLALLALIVGSPASFETSYRGRKAAISGLVVLPFVAMVFSNLYHAQLNPLLPLVPAAAAAVVFAPLAWLAMSRPAVVSPWAMFLSLIGCAAAYGYGATAMVDIQFDTSAGTVFAAPVLGKYAYHGRSSSYHLNLPPWGPRTRPDSVEVSPKTYDALNVGDTVCITLHPGVVNLPWYSTGVCAPTDAAPAA
jgi:hypothetical protein